MRESKQIKIKEFIRKIYHKRKDVPSSKKVFFSEGYLLLIILTYKTAYKRRG